MEKHRFTVDLADEDDGRFKRLTDDLGDIIGRVPSHRGRRFPARADLLRAMLTVTERDTDIRAAVFAQAQTDLTPAQETK